MYTTTFVMRIVMVLCLLMSFLYSYSQSPTYLTGNKTGNIYQTGSLVSLGTGNAGVASPMSEHRTGIFNTLRFYYGNSILNSNSGTPTTVSASRVLGLGGLIGSGADAYIQFRNTSNQNIASGVTTYFKIGSAPSTTGLSASVGGLLGLSDVYNITGRGYSGAGDYVLTSSYNENVGTASGTVAGTTTQFLLDESGVWYIAVTPDAVYNSIRLNVAFNDSLNLVSLTRDMDVDVYSAFYYNTSSGLDCGTPIFTTAGETSGVNLNLGSATSLLALDTAVTNPQHAIDNDTTSYSRITSGAVGIATTVSQTILFNDNGTATDVAKVRLSLPLSALTVTVLSNLELTAYKGTTKVGTSQSVYSLLDADLLGLLGDNTPFDVNLTPGGAFDRVKVSLKNLVSIGSSVLGGGVRIYDMKRVTNAPVVSVQPSGDTVCEGETATFMVTASGDSLTYSWEYYDSGTWNYISADNPFYIPTTTTAINGRKYRVKITGGACSASKATVTSDEATLIIRSLPTTPPVHLSP